MVVASIGNDDLDGALVAAKQGLNVDPQNTQLQKQKSIIKAKKETKAAALATSAKMANDVAVTAGTDKEMLELSNQLRLTMRDCNVMKAKIMTEEKSLKAAQITKREMDDLPKDNNTKIYRGVGKMFMVSTREDIDTHLNDEMKASEAAITEMNLKTEYLEKRIKSTQQNMMELRKQ